jgi:uncharacterized membrane protein
MTAPPTEELRPVPPAPARAVEIRTRPVGFGFIGLWALLFGIWVGVVPYIGPLWGYRSNGSGALKLTMAHALLYSAPGFIAMVVGITMFSLWPRARRLAKGRSGAAMAGLLLVLCGAWLILQPAIWPIFYPTYHVFGAATSRVANFGIVLGALGGMALMVARREKQVQVAPVEVDEVAA